MKTIDVYEFNGPGYQKLFDYNDWRLAILNYIDELEPNNIVFFQAHHKTDEAFILLEGDAIIYTINQQKELVSTSLVKNKIYVVKKDVYHSHVLTKNAKLLIVEEKNTTNENSSLLKLSAEQRFFLIEDAVKRGF